MTVGNIYVLVLVQIHSMSRSYHVHKISMAVAGWTWPLNLSILTSLFSMELLMINCDQVRWNTPIHSE